MLLKWWPGDQELTREALYVARTSLESALVRVNRAAVAQEFPVHDHRLVIRLERLIREVQEVRSQLDS